MNQLRIGKFIAKLRHEKELTQEQLGNKIGVSSKTISRWENGNYMPDISLLDPISKELGVTISELLKGQRIEKENLIDESNKDILNLLKSKKKDKKIYIKFFIIGTILILIGLIISIVQTVRINNIVEDDYTFKQEDGLFISEKGAKFTYSELLILNQIYRLSDDDVLKLTQEEVDLYINGYYAEITAVHWYGSLYAVDSAVTKVNLFDAEVSVVKVTQKYLPFTTVIIEDNIEEYYCLLGYGKYGSFIFSEYKDGKCIITEKECSILKEEDVTTKLNLDYCN